MESTSKLARRALFTVLVMMIALAAADSVTIANPIVIDGASLSENVVTIVVTNLSAKKSKVRVEAKYLEEKRLYEVEETVSVAGGATVNVRLILGTITDDINPQGITEGPDPIPHVVAVSAMLSSN